MIIRPGPELLEPGLVPGGVVVHVYGAPPACRLLLERRLTSAAECEALAAADSAFVAALTRECCLVAFDGDSGERIPLAEVLG